MQGEWKNIVLQISPYRETGTGRSAPALYAAAAAAWCLSPHLTPCPFSGIIKGVDEINAVLDEHITMTQAMQFSAFKVGFPSHAQSLAQLELGWLTTWLTTDCRGALP